MPSKDVPFMTKNWKKAIRDKRKAAKTYANNSTEENGKEDQKCSFKTMTHCH